ncbi:MAG: hypothetical protein KAX49_16445 [Halanaerobiales bacterium]|nr:hypothetical protein [Halanaerobiales bacterium]
MKSKKIILVPPAKFNPQEESIKKEIQEIANFFSNYLSEFIGKNPSGSKHAIMGPVGKIFDKIKSNQWNEGALFGYLVRIHEQTGNLRMKPNQEENIKKGINKLLSLIQDVPINYRAKIIEQVDYEIYGMQKTRILLRTEEKRQDFILYLKEKYGDISALKEVWNEEIDWDHMENPSEGRMKQAKGQKKLDMKDFLEKRKKN